MKAESGASKHSTKTKDAHLLTNVKKIFSTSVVPPDKMNLITTQTGTLPLSPI